MASDVREFGLAAQFRPHFVDRVGGCVHEVDTLDGALSGIALGFGVPDLLDLQQTPVPSAHVVLAKVEGGAPTGTFEFATIGLLQDRTVLALSEQSLTWRRKGSGDHAAILDHDACGASVPIACELLDECWGQPPESVCRLWVSAHEPGIRS
jgi:hypothetical protein